MSWHRNKFKVQCVIYRRVAVISEELKKRYQDKAVASIKTVCSYMTSIMRTRSFIRDGYDRELHSAVACHFDGNSLTMEHIAHWVLKDCGLVYESGTKIEPETSTKVHACRAFFPDEEENFQRPTVQEIEATVDKYADDIRARVRE